MTSAQAQAWLDQQDAHTAATIHRVGWCIQFIGGSSRISGSGHDDLEGPPFAYTIGLHGLHHPELLILGVPPDTAIGVLNTLGERIKSGDTLTPDAVITFEQWP